MELTQDEADTIMAMRKPEPCFVLNGEASTLMEQMTANCDCPTCRFMKSHLDRIGAETETKH